MVIPVYREHLRRRRDVNPVSFSSVDLSEFVALLANTCYTKTKRKPIFPERPAISVLRWSVQIFIMPNVKPFQTFPILCHYSPSQVDLHRHVRRSVADRRHRPARQTRTAEDHSKAHSESVCKMAVGRGSWDNGWKCSRTMEFCDELYCWNEWSCIF